MVLEANFSKTLSNKNNPTHVEPCDSFTNLIACTNSDAVISPLHRMSLQFNNVNINVKGKKLTAWDEKCTKPNPRF